MFSRLVKKQRQKKFFTLIEILSAVLIISLLVVFVVPKVGAVKDNAKVAGIETNQRTVQAYLQGVVHNYDATQASLLEKELLDAFAQEDLVNPFNKGKGIRELAELTATKGAVIYSTTDNTKAGFDSAWTGAGFSKNENYAGTVLVAAYPDPNGTDGIEVSLIPFNKKGNPILSKKVVIKP